MSFRLAVVELGHYDSDYGGRGYWEAFIKGSVSIAGDGIDETWWSIKAHDDGETATVTYFVDYFTVKADVPLVLVKAEMRRILEEHDAAVAAKSAEAEN